MYEEETTTEAGPPANVDAEKTILGAVLLDGDALEQIEGRLNADDFHLDSHRRIFLAMSDLRRTGHSIDIVTLREFLTRKGDIGSIGGTAYLASLTEGLPRRPMIDEYVRIVVDKATLRRFMAICSVGIAKAAEQTRDAATVLSSTLQELDSLENKTLDSPDMESVGQWLNQNDIFEERTPGIQTGIDEYDEMTFGMHPAELTIFAGRTSMGKTAHACTISWQMARRGKSVAVFVNEQRKESFIGRMLCGRSGVSFKSYREGHLDMIEKLYIEDARKEFLTLPIYIDQRSSMSVGSIRAKSARLKRSDELDVVLVDQLSGVSAEGIYQKGMRSDEVIGEKAQRLKDMSVELGIPVGVYHQLKRESTKNEDNRPTLVDLKYSGALEDKADNVAFFHRPGYYKRDEATKNEAEIVLAKQRDGETGIVKCEFLGYNTLWRNRRKS